MNTQIDHYLMEIELASVWATQKVLHLIEIPSLSTFNHQRDLQYNSNGLILKDLDWIGF